MISYYCTRTGNEQGMRMLQSFSSGYIKCDFCGHMFTPAKEKPEHRFCKPACKHNYYRRAERRKNAG